MKKKIKDMTIEEKREYQRMKYCDCHECKAWMKGVIKSSRDNLNMRIPYPPPCSYNTRTQSIKADFNKEESN